MAATKTRPSKADYLQALIDHPRTSAEERDAARRALARVRAAQEAKGNGSDGRHGGERAGWVGIPIHYGEKYNSRLSTTEIAALIRNDVKMQQKLAVRSAEDGPGTVKVPNAIGDAPAGVKFSIRREYFSGGSAIRMTIKNAAPEWAWTTGIVHGFERQVPTEQLKALADELKALGNAYNFDGSDITTDYFHVNYYLTLDIETTDGRHRSL
ncbi:hypothetical protein ACFWXO_30950 [Kitasatospora sp. NPDC059088]|uniref:hypothetical protein n=1 Tax=Kitasatospora sp. NPDC059088 TaxID=3346722 RepID=UPI0036A9542F